MSLSTNFNTVNNSIDDISFGILRTNPKLTSNVKLVVDSMGSLYFDSIDANTALSDTLFKKVSVNPTGQYSQDLARFYKTLPTNLRYSVLKADSDLSVYSDYSKQYEDQYSYGASFNSSKLYDEQYKFLAPIWLDKNLPSHFIVYRVEGTDYDYEYSNDIDGQNHRIMEMLSKATIVKSFDLTETSKIGKYLRNHVNNLSFPEAPIIQNFEASHYTTYCGIDISKGGFAQKREYTNKDLLIDKIEILNNKIITDGFERNELVVSNLINLEFLFDDENAQNYKIYRYFGLYVNAISEGKFEVNSIVQNDFTENLMLTNGSVLTYYNLEAGIQHQDMFIHENDLKFPTLNWVRSSVGNFFHIKNGINFDNSKFIPVSLNKATVEEFKTDLLVGTIKVNILSKDAKDFIKFNVVEKPNHGDKLFLTALTELSNYEYNLTPFTYMADSTIAPGKFDGQRFSTQGELKHITHALAACITYSDNPFIATVVGESIVIEDYAQGYNRKSVAFGVKNGNISNFINIVSGSNVNPGLSNSLLPSGSLTNFDDWHITTLTGGKIEDRFIYLEKQELGKLEVGHFIIDPINKNKSEVLEIIEDAFDFNFYRICLSHKINNLSRYTNLNFYQKPINEYGKFSAIPLKDFDFDFYNTSNSEYLELELDDLIVSSSAKGLHYKYYDLASNSDFKLLHDEYYPSLFSLTEGDIINRLSNIGDVFSLDANVEIKDLKIYSEYDRLYENELKETSLLSRIVPHINKFALKDSFNARMKPYIWNSSEAFGLNNMSPNTESGLQRNPVDYNMEHFHINQIPTAFKSIDGLSKLKSYVDYLSIGELSVENLKSTTYDYFTKYMIWNGAVSDVSTVINIIDDAGSTYVFFDKSIDPTSVGTDGAGDDGIYKKNTSFVVLNFPYLINDNKTLVFQGSIPLDSSGMALIQIGDAFKIDESEIKFVKTKEQKLYSKFNSGDSYKFANTVFRGLRYIYKSRKENTSAIPIEYVYDNSANGYKFATVLNLNSEATETSYNINVIKNDAFKFVCVYINLNLQHNNVNEISYKILYELRHSYLNENLTDTSILGALDINTAYSNFTGTIDNNTEIIINGIIDQYNQSPVFEKQITITEKGGYSYLKFTYGGNQYAFQVSKVLSDTSIVVVGYPKIWDPLTGPGTNEESIAGISPYDQANLSYTYIDGGWDAFKEILDEIKAKSFKETFNNFTKKINYINVLESGEIIKDSFVLEIENGTPFYKENYIKAAVDEDKPQSYKISSIEVGKKIVERSDPYRTVMRRLNGNYVPLTKDVIYFTDIYTENKLKFSNDTVSRERLIYNKFNNTGIAFASYLTSSNLDFGLIKNYFYHKINPEAPDSTLKLSSGSDKLPLYPKIGEIAIDKKNLNLLQSKYSAGYFTKSAPNNASSLVIGTVSPIEKKSFMASTIMKVSNNYDISTYSAIKLNSIEDLNSYRTSKSNFSVAWVETEDKIYADFYIKRAILDELIEKGIKTQFDKFVNSTDSYGDLGTTLDDLEIYSEYNIAPRFIIDTINIYAREGKNLISDFASEEDPSKINKDIYKVQTNYSIESFAQERLSFRLIYNKKAATNYEFKVVVKIRA